MPHIVLFFAPNKNADASHRGKHRQRDDERRSVPQLRACVRIDQNVPTRADSPKAREQREKTACEIKRRDIHHADKKQLGEFRLKARVMQAVENGGEENRRQNPERPLKLVAQKSVDKNHLENPRGKNIRHRIKRALCKNDCFRVLAYEHRKQCAARDHVDRKARGKPVFVQPQNRRALLFYDDDIIQWREKSQKHNHERVPQDDARDFAVKPHHRHAQQNHKRPTRQREQRLLVCAKPKPFVFHRLFSPVQCIFYMRRYTAHPAAFASASAQKTFAVPIVYHIFPPPGEDFRQKIFV